MSQPQLQSPAEKIRLSSSSSSSSFYFCAQDALDECRTSISITIALAWRLVVVVIVVVVVCWFAPLRSIDLIGYVKYALWQIVAKRVKDSRYSQRTTFGLNRLRLYCFNGVGVSINWWFCGWLNLLPYRAEITEDTKATGRQKRWISLILI